jgi:hypothetical protein
MQNNMLDMLDMQTAQGDPAGPFAFQRARGFLGNYGHSTTNN